MKPRRRKDFDIQGMIRKVREGINPELRIPTDESHPINFRIKQLKNSVESLKKTQDTLTKQVNKLHTALTGLLEDIQPYMDTEVVKKGNDKATTDKSKTDKKS